MRRFGAQRAGDDGGHQLVGVQAALHQRVDLALDGELDGACRRGMAVRHVLDRDAVDLQLRLQRDGLDARARADQHRLDHAGGTRVERGGQADGVARVHDRHLDAPQRPYVLQQPHQVVALRERDAHLRQRAARALDALGRRDHRRLAGDHRLAVLVGAAAVEHQLVLASHRAPSPSPSIVSVSPTRTGAWNFSVWPT